MTGVSHTSLMVGGFLSHNDIKTINIARVDAIKEKLKRASNLYPLSSLVIISLIYGWPNGQIKRGVRLIESKKGVCEGSDQLYGFVLPRCQFYRGVH